jgi:Coenzyme A transferase
MPDPVGGEALHGVRAISPDVTIVHGVAGDEFGNVVLSPPYGEGAWGALAARRGVIASVEKIVDSVTLRRYQALTGIPAHTVRAVCEVPFGAHPYGLYSPIPEVAGYVEDEAFILEQRAASRAAASQWSWVDDWVGGVHGHADYLAKVGDERLQRLTGSASVGSWRVGLPERSYSSATGETAPTPTRDERMVLEAARIVGEKADRTDPACL